MTVSDRQSRPGEWPEHRRGFTLTELLVGLVIIGLMTAVVAPSLFRTSATELESGARSLDAGLHWTRSQGLSKNRAAPPTLDLEKHWFRASGKERERPLPAGLQLTLYSARPKVENEVRGSIRFFPDASSTGGRITLSSSRHTYLVDVDWLTGEIRLLEEGAQATRERQ